MRMQWLRTHPLQSLQACSAALRLRILREPQVILGYAVRQVAVRLPTEWAPSKNKFVSADTEGPPVHRVGVSLLGQNLRRHIRHGASDSMQQSSFCVVHSDVEVRDVRMSPLIKQDVVGLQISALQGA